MVMMMAGGPRRDAGHGMYARATLANTTDAAGSAAACASAAGRLAANRASSYGRGAINNNALSPRRIGLGHAEGGVSLARRRARCPRDGTGRPRDMHLTNADLTLQDTGAMIRIVTAQVQLTVAGSRNSFEQRTLLGCRSRTVSAWIVLVGNRWGRFTSDSSARGGWPLINSCHRASALRTVTGNFMA